MAGAVPRCACRVPNLARLREALELTQDDLADYLEISTRQIQTYEAAVPHKCPTFRVIRRLKEALALPHLRALLKANGYPHPYPETLANPWTPSARLGMRCPIDGIPYRLHAMCSACAELAGPGHHIATLSNERLCPTCQEAIKKGLRTGTR